MTTKVLVYEFGKDFFSNEGALTLSPSEVDDHQDARTGTFTRTHDDGWTITGEVHEDYYYWVNAFSAHHPQYGSVVGDFEDKVFADSEEGFQDFYKKHTPTAWNYQDI